MEIRRIDLIHLRNALHFKFHMDFIDLINEIGVSSLNITQLFNAYVALFHELDEELKRIVKSSKTKLIKEADKARDAAWLGLVETVRVIVKRHFDPNMVEAARRVLIVLETYGGVKVAKMGLVEQTSNVYNVLQELARSIYAADIALIGVGAWITELRTCNAALDNLLKERDAEEVAKGGAVLREIRSRIDAAYVAIRKHINAVVVINGSGDYELLINSHNQSIAKYRRLNKGRSNSLNPDSPDEEDSQD